MTTAHTMSKRATVSFCKKLDTQLMPVTAFLAAAAAGWKDSHDKALPGDVDERTAQAIKDLQHIALWATLNRPANINLKSE